MSAGRGNAKRAITKAVPDMLLKDIRRLVEESRRAVAVTINAELSSLYWRIRKRISEEILKGERAEYGQQIVHALSTQLQAEYGRGFTARNLFNMIRRSASSLMRKTITSTCSFSTASSNVSLPLN